MTDDNDLEEIKQLIEQGNEENKELTKIPVNAIEIVEKIKGNLNNLDQDFNYARQNIMQMIEYGNIATEELLDIARQTQHPRAFEVLSLMIKTLVDSNKRLIEVTKDKKDIEKEDGPSNVTNNLFVGSTAELHKLLKDLKKN